MKCAIVRLAEDSTPNRGLATKFLVPMEEVLDIQRRRHRCAKSGEKQLSMTVVLVPCWGHIKNDPFSSLLGFYYNKNVKLYPTRIQSMVQVYGFGFS